jgi:signal transduction histidine kinase
LLFVRNRSARSNGASDTQRRLGEPSISVRALVLRFALAGLVALVAASFITALASRRLGIDQAIEDARRVNAVTAFGIIEPNLSEDLVDMEPAALEKMDAEVREHILAGSLIRVKIWDSSGRIVYSDEPRLIGKSFTLGDDELEVLAGTRDAEAEISDLKAPENLLETEAKLLEVYRLVHTPTGTPLLFETYFRYSGVAALGRDIWGRFAPIAIGALIILELVQIPFAWQMARRLRSSQQERERLFQMAIDASEAERRRIASDLHDGVVQDLTGVSYSLAAASMGGANRPDAPTSQQVMADSAESLRESVKSLRSLLVEIYPPNLYAEGLESALTDLLARLHNRGIVTEMEVRLPNRGIARDSSALLYRSAQEALRNVVNHAEATRVRLTVLVVDGMAEMEITDNGRGFDGNEFEARVEDGHVGLRALAGLVADAGGAVKVLSEPGRGTRVLVEVPA